MSPKAFNSKNGHDLRSSLRVQENVPIHWHVQGTNTSGEGRIRNISTSGMLLESKSAFELLARSLLDIKSFSNGEKNFVPSIGLLVWSRRKRFSNDYYEYGIQFIEAEAKTIANLRERIQEKITSMAMARKVTSFVGIALIIIMMLLAAYVVREEMSISENMQHTNELALMSAQNLAGLTRHYQDLYRETEGVLVTTNQELESTKGLLAQSQVAVAELKKLNEQLKESNERLGTEAALGHDLAKQINTLAQKNDLINGDLALAQESLRLLQGEVANMDEAHWANQFYRGQIKAINRRIKQIKKQAWQAKVAAQQELDDLKSKLGNRGYLVQNGQLIKPSTSALEGSTPASEKVKINVDFF